MSPPISSASSGEGVPSTTLYPTPYSLWSMPLIPPLPSLAQSIVGQPMITSQPSMSSSQSGIGFNPTANPGSGFLPSSSTPIGYTVISSTCYPFGWSWNSGVSAPTFNITESVTTLSVLPYLGVSHVPEILPFLGGTNPFGISPFLGGDHVSSCQPFPVNVNILGNHPFHRDTYSPSDV